MKSLLIAGYGDIARRAAPLLETRFEIRTLSRANGMDLDRPDSLAALGSADAVLHCAPPAALGATDTRTANLLFALESTRILPTRLVYIGTSGVYGDCGGALVDETRVLNPQSARAARRARRSAGAGAAGTAFVHERIAAAGQPAAEAGAGRPAALSDRPPGA